KRYNGKGVINNTRLYTGREYEKELKLYYNRARYYNPQLGRFISRDPIDISDDLNLYTYVGNNPVNNIDLDGLKAKTLIQKITTIAGDFIEYEEGYITSGGYHVANSITFGILDEGLFGYGGFGVIDQMKNDNSMYARGFINGDENGYMLDTAVIFYSFSSLAKTGVNTVKNSGVANKITQNYQLIDKTTGQLMKYGETIYTKTRYTQKFLKENNLKIIIEEGYGTVKKVGRNVENVKLKVYDVLE
ncbi:hypothetical protein EOM39_07355, partial [Candidatus Gracilibacteria bacterium]|nr:hypothetical protein [Candidatus Gracilibacteria bacterium]